MQNDEFWKTFEDSMPLLVPRKSVYKLTGGLISAGVLANLDSKNLGPLERFRIGKHVCYSREALIQWLRSRVK